jgi:hypothetical protein
MRGRSNLRPARPLPHGRLAWPAPDEKCLGCSLLFKECDQHTVQYPPGESGFCCHFNCTRLPRGEQRTAAIVANANLQQIEPDGAVSDQTTLRRYQRHEQQADSARPAKPTGHWGAAARTPPPKLFGARRRNGPKIAAAAEPAKRHLDDAQPVEPKRQCQETEAEAEVEVEIECNGDDGNNDDSDSDSDTESTMDIADLADTSWASQIDVPAAPAAPPIIVRIPTAFSRPQQAGVYDPTWASRAVHKTLKPVPRTPAEKAESAQQAAPAPVPVPIPIPAGPNCAWLLDELRDLAAQQSTPPDPPCPRPAAPAPADRGCGWLVGELRDMAARQSLDQMVAPTPMHTPIQVAAPREPIHVTFPRLDLMRRAAEATIAHRRAMITAQTEQMRVAAEMALAQHAAEIAIFKMAAHYLADGSNTDPRVGVLVDASHCTPSWPLLQNAQ